MEKFLYIELIFLPDPKVNQSDLDEKIKQLKERITNNHSPNFFFKEYFDNFTIPAESFGLYMQTIWNKISNNKTNNNFVLDLSETKLLIINFMFESLKNKVYKEILVNFFMKIKKSIMENEYVDLSNVGKEILQESERSFHSYTKSYYKTNDFVTKEKELMDLIKQDLLDIFIKQVTMLKKTSPKKLNEMIVSENITCKNNIFLINYIIH